VRPRVGIDAHFLTSLQGNRSYVLALLRALARSGASERFEITAYGCDPVPDAASVGDAASAFAWGPPLPRSALLRFAYSVGRAQRRDRLDLWHATFVAPPGRARLVLAVHDALALTRPELLPEAVARRLSLLLPRSIGAAARVLVPTRTVEGDLLAHGLGAGKTIVAPIGVDGRVFTPLARPEDAALRGAAGVDERPYLLAVGRADPRKRLPWLIRTFARLAPGSRLVLAGPLGGGPARALEGEARAAGLAADRLVVVDAAPEETLAALYRGAHALVFPSLGEGLGLPIVEALACGTPVIATDLPVVREVAGDAALALVTDEAGLLAALERALALGVLDRAPVARRGVAASGAFALEAMAAATERAWREALG
jgi:glycosyltransferase involved in cell wall biosynthesis